MKIEIVLFDGFDEVDAIGPFEVLRNAQVHGGVDADVALVGLAGPGEVVASHGLRVVVDAGPSDAADVVIVPGGGWNDRANHGARTEAERGELPELLRAASARGAAVASVCTGGMIVAASGLTDGRPATTHHGAIEDLRASGAEVVDARVVDDGDLITSGGVTSGFDMALWLVEREWGRALADAIAREMELERQGRVWQRHGQ
jgi:transcriptional regulator GlxA family with amidase domain